MHWASGLAVLFLVSGCAAPEAVPPIGDGASPSEGPVVAETPPGSAAGEPSPASPGNPGTPPASGPDQAVPTAPVVASCDVAMEAAPAMLWAFGYGFGSIVPPAEGVLFPAGCSAGELVPSGGSFRSAVVEFDWENAAPMVDVELVLIVRDGPVLVVESATSPIRIEISDADLPEGPVDLTMDYGGTGAYLDFEGTTWFSVFETASPPEGYTAIP